MQTSDRSYQREKNSDMFGMLIALYVQLNTNQCYTQLNIRNIRANFTVCLSKLKESHWGLLTDAVSLWRKGETAIWYFVVGLHLFVGGEELWLCEWTAGSFPLDYCLLSLRTAAEEAKEPHSTETKATVDVVLMRISPYRLRRSTRV